MYGGTNVGAVNGCSNPASVENGNEAIEANRDVVLDVGAVSGRPNPAVVENCKEAITSDRDIVLDGGMVSINRVNELGGHRGVAWEGNSAAARLAMKENGLTSLHGGR
jgi:hypothetical protein